MSSRTCAMTSEGPPATQPGLVGIFDPRRGRDPARAHAMSRAIGIVAPAAIDEPGFALAHADAVMHRDGDRVCVIEGRVTNLDVLAARAGCPPGASAAAGLATLYEREGAAALQALEGQFLVVLWDSRRQSGLLARDQLGARTMFVRSSGSRLEFASDIALLLRIAATRPDVDSLGLTQWLMLGGTVSGRTVYAGIERLGPGALLTFDRHGRSERTYWRPQFAAPLRISRDDAAEELRHRLRRAAGTQFDGAGPVGVMLSGGLDSSTVAATAAEALGERRDRLVGFSMTFPHHPAIDESPLIAHVAEHLRIPSVQMQVLGGSPLIGGLEFLRAWQLPTSVPTTVFSTRLQARAAALGVTVMLDGDGGDELFGADELLPAAHLRAGRLSAAWKLCRRVPGFGANPSTSQVMRAFRVLALRGAAPGWLNRARRSMRRPEELTPEWLAGSAAQALAASYDPWAWKRSRAPLWWSHLVDTTTGHSETVWAYDYLRQIGALSGVRAAHPLLDPRVVEFILQLPPEYAYDPRFDRALLRHSMRGLVPERIRTRADKSYFTEIIRGSLLGRDLPLITRTLSAPDAEIRAYVNPSLLERQLRPASLQPPPRGFELHLWRLLMAEYWLRSQADADLPERVLAGGSLTEPQVQFTELPIGSHRSEGPRPSTPPNAGEPTFSVLDQDQKPRTLSS